MGALQYVIDSEGKTIAVQIPIEYWDLIRSELEFDEISDFDEALARLKDAQSEFIEHEEVKRGLEV